MLVIGDSFGPLFNRGRGDTAAVLALPAYDPTMRLESNHTVPVKRLSVNQVLSFPVSPEQQPSRLETLPQELALEILAYLPVESQACLAVCSRTMAKKLGEQNLLALRTKGGHLQYLKGEVLVPRYGRSLLDTPYPAYLRLVERDRLDLFYCHECIRLHSIDGEGVVRPEHYDDVWPQNCGQSPRPFLRLVLGPSYHLSFHHIQLAMARKRYYGLPNGRLDMLNYSTKPTIHPGSLVKSFDIEARCSANHLILRTQHTLRIMRNEVSQAQREFSSLVCQHHEREENFRGYSRRGIELFECLQRHDTLRSNTCRNCRFEGSCYFCPTETSINKHKIGPDLLLVVVTQWRDFGRALTPTDRIWKAHTTSFWHRRQDFPGFINWEWKKPEFGLASIRRRFEQQSGDTVEELTESNLRYLKSTDFTETGSKFSKAIHQGDVGVQQGNLTIQRDHVAAQLRDLANQQGDTTVQQANMGTQRKRVVAQQGDVLVQGGDGTIQRGNEKKARRWWHLRKIAL